MSKYKVLQIAAKLDLGGTEKTLQLFSQHLNKDLFKVVVCGWVEGGVRAEQLKAEGFKVFCSNNDKLQLIKVMKDEKIQIVHVHRSGFGDNFVIEAAQNARVPVIIETNVFGRVDETSWEKYIDCHIFISKTCALRYKHWVGLNWESFFQRHRVLYYPISLAEIDWCRFGSKKIAELKKHYNIPVNAPVVGRIGRPAPAKWPAPEAFTSILRKLISLVPEAKILLMGAPTNILDSLAKTKLYNKVIPLEPSPDPERVMEFYSMIDVLLHLAKIGESFGLVIAEAMAMGKPVITRATPLHDDAQVELIDHGSNGYVAYDEKALAEATADLLSNDHKRKEMGLKARRKVETFYDVDQVTRQLESLYLEFLEKKGVRVDASVSEEYRSLVSSPTQDEIANFENDYKKRVRTCWGKPSWSEILGYEYLFRHQSIYNMARQVKKIAQVLPGTMK